MDRANDIKLIYYTESDNIRIVRAIVFSTWMYGSLFLVYILSRLIFTPTWAHLNDYFITGFPFFTFYTTGLSMLIVSLISLVLYIALQNSSRPKNRSYEKKLVNRPLILIMEKPKTAQNMDLLNDEAESKRLKQLRMSALVTWVFSTLIWAYISYTLLTNPLTLPHWHIGMIMFVLSFFSMVIYCATRNPSRPNPSS